MTNSLDTKIKIAYEQENMTPEQIAEDEGLEVVSVKAKLMQVSSVYRKDCNVEEVEEDTLNFNNDQMKDVVSVIHQIAMDTDVDASVRLKAACYIRDDKKGRKEVVKALAGNQFNIFQFNEQLAVARSAMKKLLPA